MHDVIPVLVSFNQGHWEVVASPLAIFLDHRIII